MSRLASASAAAESCCASRAECPHCGLESMPWTYHARVWWRQDPPGTWQWFDEDFERWRRYDGATSITLPVMETTPGRAR